jgi:hypothetical protein
MIETCAKLGATSLRYGDLQVRFRPDPQLAVDQPTIEVATISEERGEGILTSLPERMSIADPDLLEDMRRSQLMIDDPYSFEQEMIDQHLRQGAVNEKVEDRRA